MEPTVCGRNLCTGCNACREVCPKAAIEIEDGMDCLNAKINMEKCINCNACRNVCHIVKEVERKKIELWSQGWAGNPEVRRQAASGGMASAIINAFIDNGGYVCACLFVKGNFEFVLTQEKKYIEQFSGSKYVKSNTKHIYSEIKRKLAENNKVLFIGLPCQVAGLINYLPVELAEFLYTIDLICHGTPSEKLLDVYLKQHQVDISECSDITFRTKFGFHVNSSDNHAIVYGAMDCYSIAFMYGLSYTEGCYHCKYACEERVADITLGDSWGSELDDEEKSKGVSLVLCQSEKGKELLENSDIVLKEVDLKKAVSNNMQLRMPSLMPRQRKFFFKGIHKGNNFDFLTLCCFPKYVVKEWGRKTVKQILINLGLRKSGGGYSIIVRYDNNYGEKR
ncbi:MAG: Coenzyme F420 hydrogenase/dehydrogenase, beta subunit C-terminal domain [Clostridium sp.]|nr:Coenzyme F420 hydrogenase/dehydrogenase, beta subunit C-terminal domain [Clostridium sp.]